MSLEVFPRQSLAGQEVQETNSYLQGVAALRPPLPNYSRAEQGWTNQVLGVAPFGTPLPNYTRPEQS